MKQRFRTKNDWDFCQKPWKKVFSTNYYVRNSLSTDAQFSRFSFGLYSTRLSLGYVKPSSNTSGAGSALECKRII